MISTKRRVLQILVALILLTLGVNGIFGLFFYIRGRSSSTPFSEDEDGKIDLWGQGQVIRNNSIHSIRFRVESCDINASGDELVILVGPGVNPTLLQIAQRIRQKYSELTRSEWVEEGGWSGSSNKGPAKMKGSGSRSRGRVLPPTSVTRLQRLLEPVPVPQFRPRLDKKQDATDTPPVWGSIREWPFSDSLRLVSLGQVLTTAATAGIRGASPASRGTQNKVELTLDGGQIGLWKPKAYPRDVVLQGTAYAGKDRHYGEIAAFYLNLLLGYNNAPITTGRWINLQTELLPVANPSLKATFFRDSNSSLCFYGVCHFCTKTDPVCQNGRESNQVEGALVLWMHKKYKTVPNPWRRTYSLGVPAPWEVSMGFCNQLLRDVPRLNRAQMILDIVGVAVFDFLIGNGDRHNLEMLLQSDPDFSSHTSKILLMDNGKSFGNPWEDYLDILAPLFQCCKIRKSLYSTLTSFQGKLGPWLDLITKNESFYPLLTKENLRALDRRLKVVLATVNYCKDSVQRHNALQKNPSLHKKLFYGQV